MGISKSLTKHRWLRQSLPPQRPQQAESSAAKRLKEKPARTWPKIATLRSLCALHVLPKYKPFLLLPLLRGLAAECKALSSQLLDCPLPTLSTLPWITVPYSVLEMCWVPNTASGLCTLPRISES